jgi:steroid delta-isomerase-like uncharacterized protein
VTVDTNKNIVQRWINEAWGGVNLDLADELVTANYVFRAPGLPDARGPDGIKGLIGMFRTAFPDLSNTIEEQIAEGGMVMTRGTTTGTHQGPFGEMPPTGKSISVQWVMVSRFEGDRIAEDFEVYDSLGLMQQLGAVPAPA